jgi:hypothetical protein
MRATLPFRHSLGEYPTGLWPASRARDEGRILRGCAGPCWDLGRRVERFDDPAPASEL